MMYGYGAGLDAGSWLGMLGMIAVVIAIVLLVVWLVGRATSSPQPQGPAAPIQGQDVLELLRVRFARGEITKDEYLAARQVLESER